MPPLAVRLLLALVLCLNGFLAPVAVAQHADVAAAVAQDMPGCHGDDGDGDSAPVTPANHDGAPSCCTPGHCVCACVFSASLPVDIVAGSAMARSQAAPLPRAVALQPACDSVPLRPPIA